MLAASAHTGVFLCVLPPRSCAPLPGTAFRSASSTTRYPRTMFRPDDAQRVFEHLANVEAAKAGRDFVYTIRKTDDSSVTGQVVGRDGGWLDLVVEDDLGNRAAQVAWDEIESITITSS